MSDERELAGSAAEPLQFDRAEPVASTGAVLKCALCQQEMTHGEYFQINDRSFCPDCRSAVIAAEGAGGSGGRLVRALGLGSLAAVIGAGLYFGVAAATGYEFGLVAIVVGFLVGEGVRRGSQGRGGAAYQAMAMLLTYGAIVATYVPGMLRGLEAAGKELNGLTICVLALASPFLAGVENIMGLLIIGFALYEAWKLNRRVRLRIAGPFQIGHGPA
jgi:hypothetical protein